MSFFSAIFGAMKRVYVSRINVEASNNLTALGYTVVLKNKDSLKTKNIKYEYLKTQETAPKKVPGVCRPNVWPRQYIFIK